MHVPSYPPRGSVSILGRANPRAGENERCPSPLTSITPPAFAPPNPVTEQDPAGNADRVALARPAGPNDQDGRRAIRRKETMEKGKGRINQVTSTELNIQTGLDPVSK